MRFLFSSNPMGECHVPLLSRTFGAQGRERLGGISRRIRPTLHEADALLEARSLLSTLMIDAIYRTTSLSPYNGTIRDPVTMSPGLSGQTTTLVGYTVATDPAITGTTSIPFGGTGFEVDFTNTTGQDATVTVQWGGGEGSASASFGPGTTSATFPHVYLQAGTYPVQITARRRRAVVHLRDPHDRLTDPRRAERDLHHRHPGR